MIFLQLLKLTEEYVQYKFFPNDNKQDFGIVQVDRKTLKRTLIKDTKGDFETVYKGMAWGKVAKMVKANNFP
ncbi:MAG: hypothetical protein IKK97_01095, partial [Phascolarctobacterium sp.]|nr:hypothetical protein [Phascolarctobacterium sp.]